MMDRHIQPDAAPIDLLSLPPNQMLSEREVADLCRLSPKTLRNWRALKAGPRPTRLGRAVRYRVADVAAFIAAGEWKAA